MPRGLRKIKISVDGSGITRFGGLVLFQQFCNSIALRRFLQKRVHWPEYADRKFHPADLFLTHLYAKVAGLGRVESLKGLKLNGLLPALLGLPEPPHRDTLRTFLWRFAGPDIHRLAASHDHLRSRLFQMLGPAWSAVVDMDTTALTVYGKQEGSSLGYNPGRQGKRCYSALLASEAKTGMSLGIDLRAGKEHPSTGALPMLRESLAKLPSTVASARTRVRADASFYDRDIAEFLDGERLGYAITARMTAPLRNLVAGAHFRLFREGWAAAEFKYQPTFWKKPHRFIAIRHFLKEEDARTFLFRIKDYDFRVLVTNLDMDPEAVWRFYRDRATQELVIRELKSSFAAAQIPARSFLANAAHLEVALWAYDLVLAFKKLCLPERSRNWTVATLRRDLWCTPGQWVRTDNRNLLRLPASFRHVELLRHAQREIPRMKSLI
jgi:Transposase DDE domain group 1